MTAAIDDLVRRLSDRFPDVADQHVVAVVTEERQRLTNRPIQDFIPILVERAAADRLRRGATPAIPNSQRAVEPGGGNEPT